MFDMPNVTFNLTADQQLLVDSLKDDPNFCLLLAELGEQMSKILTMPESVGTWRRDELSSRLVEAQQLLVDFLRLFIRPLGEVVKDISDRAAEPSGIEQLKASGALCSHGLDPALCHDHVETTVTADIDDTDTAAKASEDWQAVPPPENS